MLKFISSSPLLIITIAAFALAKCGARSEQSEIKGEDPVIVKLATVEKVRYSPTLKYSGLIASKTEARPSFKIGGIISKIYVKEGDQVVRGQLLATLDLTEINAQVQQSQLNVEKSRRDAKRMQNLYNDTVVSLEQLQNVNTQLDVASQGLKIAQFNRHYAQIRATEKGTVLRKLMNEGELASSGSPVFYMIGNSSGDWVVRFGVADKDWAIIRKGDRADITIDAYPGKMFTGFVTEVADAADLANGTYEIEVKVLPGGNKFAPGLFSTIELKTASLQDVIMIPVEALVEGNGKNGFVYTLNADGKTVTKNPVAIAFLENNRVAISNGLSNASHVITDGAGYLTPTAIVKTAQ